MTIRAFIALIAGASLPLGGCTSKDSSSTPEVADGSALDVGAPAADGGSEGTGVMWDGGTIATIVMPRISGSAYSGTEGGVPAFASSSFDYQTVASSANDDDPLTSWSPAQLPAWIAYDLSPVPVGLRQDVIVAWNALHASSYLNTSTPSGAEMPTDYTIEINAAPGGMSAPPTDGWVQSVNVNANLRNTVESPLDLGGGNWLRMSVTGSSDTNALAIDLDVFSAPNGGTDCWMFMGDSITYITMNYAFSDLPQLVHQARPDRWPAVINAALGGTNTQTAALVIDDTMAGFVGRYVVLAYGTNDDPNIFEMETLVQDVLAAGKIPVIPLMPWSDTSTVQASGPLINLAIQALYVKYPQIVPGPDLWSAFLNRTDLIPSGDVHPNDAGEEYLRQQWATMMAAIP